ncbi:glycoside hydrolase family 55 protein [Clostridium bowmanii]|uniref:right-handed parallel beta-helix repeat-containing protein n=1 Tax=Clostridium bowmanii TaxID=132925 RepID=UPI001C0DAD36|nr:glycosyl hydrolase family 28-related protein [Clostridium bowmanii]MBU3188419.1 glycoside hydrolase family 55 protein [Clostridium bowmanii]MCA1072808.1 glycoside hydrolase family 55 protein [Clostridium bowmanii]
MKKIKFYKRTVLRTIFLLSIAFVLINVVSYINHGFSFVDLHITHSVINVKTYGAKLDGKHFDDKALINAIGSIEDGTVYIPKGTLLIPDGVTITVPKGINITGEDFNKTRIKQINGYPSNKIFNPMGNQRIRDITIDSKLGIKPSGGNIDIYRCKFINGTQAIQVADTVNNLKIRNCVFQDNLGYSILFNKNPSYDCLISNCVFDGTKSDFIEINAPCMGIKIENCSFKDNKCTGQWAGFGIGVAVRAKEIIINNCSFYNINGQGIHVEDKSQVSISKCNFRNCGSVEYKGSPKSDIAVLSGAKIEISKSTHYEPQRKYSEIPVFCTGAVAKASEGTYYKRSASYGLSSPKGKE